MSDTPLQKSHIDAAPLIRALQTIRDVGRHRKEVLGIDDQTVQFARLANHTLLWMDLDEKGQIEQASDHLDAAHRLVIELAIS